MFSFSSGVGRDGQQARLEGPRANYAPPGFRIGMTRALRERQLPTKRCHAALPAWVTRAYQPDSSSKPPARQPRAGALGKSSIHPQGILACQHRPRDRGRRHNPLDSRSFHISWPARVYTFTRLSCCPPLTRCVPSGVNLRLAVLCDENRPIGFPSRSQSVVASLSATFFTRSSSRVPNTPAAASVFPSGLTANVLTG